jgi:hypothetical protein
MTKLFVDGHEIRNVVALRIECGPDRMPLVAVTIEPGKITYEGDGIFDVRLREP